MDKKFQIDKAKIEAYIRRTLKHRLRSAILIMGVFLLCFSAYLSYKALYFVLPLVPIILVICFFIVKSDFKKQQALFAKAVFFEINANGISRSVDNKQLSLMEKIQIARAQRHGHHTETSIDFSLVSRTTVTDTEIKIKSTKANFLTDNGIIVLPKELNNFGELRHYVLSNPKLFKVEQ